MMSDDIEAMARAICAAKGHNPDEEIVFSDSNQVRRLRWTDWIPHAEGAYEALHASGRLAPAVEGDGWDKDSPLTAEEEMMVNAAWERHKAAKPTAEQMAYRESVFVCAIKAGCAQHQADVVADEALGRFIRYQRSTGPTR